MSNPDTEVPGEYASPACLAHEVDPDYMGLFIEPAPGSAPGGPANSGLVTAVCSFLARW